MGPMGETMKVHERPGGNGITGILPAMDSGRFCIGTLFFARTRIGTGLLGLLAGVGLLVGLTACQPDSPKIVHRSELHMGTTVTITVVAADSNKAQSALDLGFAEVAAMEAIFSSYRTDSDLARVNAAAGDTPVTVPEPFIALLEHARTVAWQSHGAFNPLVGPAIKRWGIPEAPRVPSDTELAELRSLLDLSEIHINPIHGEVYLARPGMALGLGGIAKGFSADRVVARLKEYGILAGIVAVAGDVTTFGQRPDGAPWRIGVRNPKGGDAPLRQLALSDGAVSTSGDYERFFELDGVRYHHILDPRTLHPARAGLTAVSVIAPSGVLADGYATALFVMGSRAGVALVEQLDGVEALFVTDTGAVITTGGWPDG